MVCCPEDIWKRWRGAGVCRSRWPYFFGFSRPSVHYIRIRSRFRGFIFFSVLFGSTTTRPQTIRRATVAGNYNTSVSLRVLLHVKTWFFTLEGWTIKIDNRLKTIRINCDLNEFRRSGGHRRKWIYSFRLKINYLKLYWQ